MNVAFYEASPSLIFSILRLFFLTKLPTYFETPGHVPKHPVMSPNNLSCPQTTCHVPKQPVMSPNNLSYPQTHCHVPKHTVMSPNTLSCPQTSKSVRFPIKLHEFHDNLYSSFLVFQEDIFKRFPIQILHAFLAYCIQAARSVHVASFSLSLYSRKTRTTYQTLAV